MMSESPTGTTKRARQRGTLTRNFTPAGGVDKKVSQLIYSE